MHFPNKKIIELSFEMGLFYEHFTFGNQKHTKKNIAQIYVPYTMICSTVFLFFESSVFLFLSFYFFKF